MYNYLVLFSQLWHNFQTNIPNERIIMDLIRFANTDSNESGADELDARIESVECTSSSQGPSNTLGWKRDEFKFANTDSNQSSSDAETLFNQHKIDSEDDVSCTHLEAIICETDEDEHYEVPVDGLSQKTSCNRTCVNKCNDAISSLSDADRVQMKKKFAGSKLDYKNVLLQHVITQEHMDLGISRIYWKKHHYCAKAFSELVGRSEYITRKVLVDVKNGTKRYIHGNSVKSRESLASINFTAWMLIYIHKHGQNSPDDLVTVLPAYLYKGKYYLSSSILTSIFQLRSSRRIRRSAGSLI